jgi:hypothetical protein
MPVARLCESVMMVVDLLACDGIHFALVLEGRRALDVSGRLDTR